MRVIPTVCTTEIQDSNSIKEKQNRDSRKGIRASETRKMGASEQNLYSIASTSPNASNVNVLPFESREYRVILIVRECHVVHFNILVHFELHVSELCITILYII